MDDLIQQFLNSKSSVPSGYPHRASEFLTLRFYVNLETSLTN